jgi:hypothetical protein
LSMPILAMLYITWGRNNRAKFIEVGPQSTKGVGIPKMQGDGFASEPGGIMEVAMWLCAPLLL